MQTPSLNSPDPLSPKEGKWGPSSLSPNIFKKDKQVDSYEGNKITELYNTDKQALRKFIRGELRGFINTDFRAENEKILGGPVGVKKLQIFLKNASGGQNNLEIDGRFGPETFYALIEYQSAHEYPPTGIVSDFLQKSVGEVTADVFQGNKKIPSKQFQSTGISSTISQDQSARIGYSVNGARVDADVKAWNESAEAREKARITAKLLSFQRETIRLEEQQKIIHTFLEEEVGVVARTFDSLAKVSLPLTGKKLYQTGEDTTDTQIRSLREQSASLQRRLISEIPSNFVLSESEKKIVDDLMLRSGKLSQYVALKKTWSDLALTEFGGKNIPAVVMFHRVYAGVLEGMYTSVEHIIGAIYSIVQICVDAPYRDKVIKDITEVIQVLNADSLAEFIKKLPEIFEQFSALPADRKVEGVAKFLGGVFVPVGAGAVLFGKGKSVAKQGMDHLKKGSEEIKRAVTPDTAKTPSASLGVPDTPGASPAVSKVSPNAASPQKPSFTPVGDMVSSTPSLERGLMTVTQGAGEIFIGSTLITAGGTTRVLEGDLGKGGKHLHSPAPQEVLVFSDQLLKDIRTIRSFVHRAGNVEQKDVGTIMTEITRLHKLYTAELNRLKETGLTAAQIDSPLLQEIHQKIQRLHTHKESLIDNPNLLSSVLKVTTREACTSKAGEIYKTYSKEHFVHGSSEYFKSEYISAIARELEKNINISKLTPEEGLKALQELHDNPVRYVKMYHDIQLMEEVAHLRRMHLETRKDMSLHGEKITLQGLDGEFDSLLNSLKEFAIIARKQNEVQMEALHLQLAQLLEITKKNYQSSPNLFRDQMESALRELIHMGRLHPKIQREKEVFVKQAGKLLAIIEERGDVGMRHTIEGKTYFVPLSGNSQRPGKKMTHETNEGKFHGKFEKDGTYTGEMYLSGGGIMTGKRGQGKFSDEGHFLFGELQLPSGAKLSYDVNKDPAFTLLNPSKNPPYPHMDALFGDMDSLQDIYRLYHGRDMRTILEAHLHVPALLQRKGLIQEDIIYLLKKMDTIEQEVQKDLRRKEPLKSVFARIQ